MNKLYANVSDEAVKKATGKVWLEWFKLLDQEKAQEKPHKEIAALLYDKGYLKNKWWCQQVTVGYEYHIGRRILGQTATAGFEMGFQKTLPISAKKAWDLMTKPPGRDIWLGKINKMRFVKSQAYQTEEGTSAEIRSIVPGKKIRLTWKPREWEQPSTLQIYLLPKGNNTSFRFHQEKLLNQQSREQMRKHWQQVIKELEQLI